MLSFGLERPFRHTIPFAMIILHLRSLIITLSILCWSVVAGATTYYIDPQSGNDSNAGTSTSTPWATIPGTMNTANTRWLSTSWGGGRISASNPVPAGTVFMLKSGATFNSSTAGQILFNSSYYLTTYTLSNPVIIQRDTSWGSGTVTFDGTGITLNTTSESGWGLLHFQVGGIQIDGAVPDGIWIQNSHVCGISHYQVNSLYPGLNVYRVHFYNNGTVIPDGADAASEGDIKVENAIGGTYQYLTLDGNGQYINGFCFGDTGGGAHNVTGWLIDSVRSFNHRDPGNYDCGIGVKIISGSGTVSNSTLYSNFKGADNGDKSASLSPVLYYINNLVYNNTQSGINGNGGTAVGINSVLTMYLINNIIWGNGSVSMGGRGSDFYDGSMNLYIVHNVYDGNGNPADLYSSWNLAIGNNGAPPEGSAINAYLYNNIFYKPNVAAGGQNLAVETWLQTTPPVSGLNWYADYNSYVQSSAGEYFNTWGLLSPSDQTTSFTYGLNGPGHASGNWYTDYGGSTSQPISGALGHYQQDSHSKGTGAADATLPPFKNAAIHDYTLTSSYAGTNLSVQPWYISEMGLRQDRCTAGRMGHRGI